ncbi:hypothetical protein M9H77_23376 [Catharanthus roseus]|uniref:Uncharacterized protein n=1 Tax=Catharanthus roseus TaxID=4058 RepID=A0ACC0AW23_CATRO|nr:hypothetical protein M9H77_23376 [Catharanthus roseus]
MSQSPLGLKLRPITRAQMKKLKLQEDNDMIACMEDALKSKIEELNGQGKLPKLFTVCSIVKKQLREQLELRVLVLDLMYSRSSSLCDCGFEALVFHWSVEATKFSIEILQSQEVILGRIWIQFNSQRGFISN